MALAERAAGRSVARSSRNAREHPDRVFLVFGDRRLTYRQVDARASALAAALHGSASSAGDRIALDLPNWPEFVLSMFAAAKLGAVIVPLNPRYTVPELQYMLRHSEATVVVSAENFNGVDYLQLFEGFLTSLPDLQYVVTVGEEDLWYDDRIYQFEDLESSGAGRPCRTVEIDPAEDVFAILYTSGTMGKPKGVALTHENLLQTAAETAEAIELTRTTSSSAWPRSSTSSASGRACSGTLLAGAGLVLQEQFDPADRPST
jgi:fatty-acyl-CoA synthase